MKFYKDIVEAHPNSQIYDKCWDGYKKVPGKTRGEKGSCEKISNEAYDAWDEADMWYQFDTSTKKLKQKTWYHAQEREARANGWHDSHDKAMQAHGYFPSKFKKGEYVVKGDDGKWIKVYPYADKTVKEFAPAGGGTPPRGPKTPGRDPWGGDDGPGDDPYSRPEPKHYGRSIDFFGRFEADHFDDEVFDEKTGVFKGYWDDEEGRVQIAYFKFDDPTRTGSDDPGMGWYYEPASDGNSNNTSAKPAVDNSAQRKQQELGMIDAFLKSGQKAKPGSQIYALMKKHGLAEDAEPMDREFGLVKKLGRLGERIVQNPKLWAKYNQAIDNNDNDWIVSFIMDGTGATFNEVLRLDDLFGEIGGGLGRLIDFAWAVKEGTWEEDFLKPFLQYKKQGMTEGESNLEEIDRRGFLKGMGAAAVAGAASSAMAAPFRHSTNVDQMTGKDNGKYSEVRSDNSNAILSIQWPGHKWPGVFIDIPRTVINFGVYGATGRIKINGSVKDVRLDRLASGNYSGAFIDISPRSVLTTSGDLWIEIPIYNEGNKVFKFTIEPDSVTKAIPAPAPKKPAVEKDKTGPEEKNSDAVSQREVSVSASYAGRIQRSIRPNITGQSAGNVAVEIKSRPDGTIISRRLVKSSGDLKWDQSVLNGIDKTGTLPRDVDGTVPSTVTINLGESTLEDSVTKKPQPYNEPGWVKKLPKEKLDAIAGSKYKKNKKEQGVAESVDGIKTILSLLKDFAKTRKEPEDQETIAGIYKAFQQGMEPGFTALFNAWEFDIDADFYYFARNKGVDLHAVADQAGFDTDSVREGSETPEKEFGAYYYEQLAQQVFDQDKNLDATGQANQVMDAGFAIASKELGKKQARYLFAYDEDFPSDFVTAYDYLQKNKQVKEQNMSDNSSGYKNTLAVMKAADSSQEATISLGGEPVTLDYPEARFIAGKYKAFLRAGRQEEFFGYMSNAQQFDSMMKQLRGLHDKQKAFKGSVPGERGVPGETTKPWTRESSSQSVAGYFTKDDDLKSLFRKLQADGTEGDVRQFINWALDSGQYNMKDAIDLGAKADWDAMSSENSYPGAYEGWERAIKITGYQPGKTQTPWIREGVDNDSPVAGAITHRIMIQRHDLLSKYGPAKVLAAIDDVADFVGDVEEIGSSDVSAWVKQVEQALAGMGESELDEGWKEKLGAAALAGTLAFGAAGNAMARVTPDGQGGYTGGKPVATQMAPAATQAAQPGAEMPGKNLQAVDSIDGNKSSGYTITQDGKSYDVKVVPKGSPTPRGAKMMKVSQAQLGERGIGNYVVYLLNSGTAYLYMGDVSEAAPGLAKAAGGLALGGIAAAGAPALVGILGPLVGIPFAAYAAYSAAKLGMKGVEKLWDMASEKLGSDDKVEQYATAQIAKLPPDQKQAAVATIKQLGESRKLVKENLRLVGKHGDGAKTAKVYKDHEWGEYRVKFYTDGKHEGEAADYHTDDRGDANDTAKSWTTKGEKVAESTYWCRQEKTRKLIPEGYKKTAQGYITKV